MKRVIQPNFVGIFFLVVLTFLGISLAYSVIVQELSSYITTLVFFLLSISLLIRVIQEHKEK